MFEKFKLSATNGPAALFNAKLDATIRDMRECYELGASSREQEVIDARHRTELVTQLLLAKQTINVNIAVPPREIWWKRLFNRTSKNT